MQNNLKIENNINNQLMLRMAKFQEKRVTRQEEDMNELTGMIEELIGMISSTNGQLKTVENDIDDVKNVLKITQIDRFELAELDNLMKSKVFSEVGAIGSDKYILFFKKFKSNLVNSVKKQFGNYGVQLLSIKDIKKEDFLNAKRYIKSWKPTSKLKRKILQEWACEIEKEEKGQKSRIKNQEQINAFNNYMEKMI